MKCHRVAPRRLSDTCERNADRWPGLSRQSLPGRFQGRVSERNLDCGDPERRFAVRPGNGSVSTFNGGEPGVSLAGEASTGSLGVDYTGGAKTVGIMLSRSTGEGEHLFGGQEGRISARLAGLDPGYRQELWQGHSF